MKSITYYQSLRQKSVPFLDVMFSFETIIISNSYLYDRYLSIFI